MALNGAVLGWRVVSVAAMEDLERYNLVKQNGASSYIISALDHMPICHIISGTHPIFVQVIYGPLNDYRQCQW